MDSKQLVRFEHESTTELKEQALKLAREREVLLSNMVEVDWDEVRRINDDLNVIQFVLNERNG